MPEEQANGIYILDIGYDAEYSDPYVGESMSDELSQEEADGLLKMEKKSAKEESQRLPSLGAKASFPLVSMDGREEFLLDVGSSKIKLLKINLQNRARTTVILVRLDTDGAPHRNPDDVEIPCPHIHLYRAGYQHKWAYPVPEEHFRDLTDRKQTLEDFMAFCHIIAPPKFDNELFS
ncbi:MAG: DUF6978 family protein [Rhodomicrobium sp.]